MKTTMTKTSLKTLLRAAACALALTASACTHYAYEAETASFAEGVNRSTSSLRAAIEDVGKANQAEIDIARARDRWQATIAPECAELAFAATGADPVTAAERAALFERCTILGPPDGSGGREIFVARPVAPALADAASAIDAYAGALLILSTAEDEAQFRAAATDLGARIAGIGDAARTARGGPGDEDAEKQITTLTAFATEVALTGLAARKRAALLKALDEVHPALEGLTAALTVREEQLLKERVRERQADLDAAEAAATDAPTPANQDAVIAALAAFEAAAAARWRTGGRLAGIARAHAALRDAVRDPASRAAIGAFAARANALLGSARDVVEAGDA